MNSNAQEYVMQHFALYNYLNENIVVIRNHIRIALLQYTILKEYSYGLNIVRYAHLQKRFIAAFLHSRISNRTELLLRHYKSFVCYRRD